jgi:hypothetical protein
VPHHTASSWSTHWARDPLVDRLLEAAREWAIGSYQDQDSTGDAGGIEESIEDDQQSVEEESSHDSDEDEAAMGKHGSVFGEAEIRVMAKYIAKHTSDEWAMMTSKQRWFPFHEEVTHLDPYIEAYSLKWAFLCSILIVQTKRMVRNIAKRSRVGALKIVDIMKLRSLLRIPETC